MDDIVRECLPLLSSMLAIGVINSSVNDVVSRQEMCRGIMVRTEWSEGGNFTVLGKIELEGTSKHLHDLPV